MNCSYLEIDLRSKYNILHICRKQYYFANKSLGELFFSYISTILTHQLQSRTLINPPRQQIKTSSTLLSSRMKNERGRRVGIGNRRRRPRLYNYFISTHGASTHTHTHTHTCLRYTSGQFTARRSRSDIRRLVWLPIFRAVMARAFLSSQRKMRPSRVTIGCINNALREERERMTVYSEECASATIFELMARCGKARAYI